MAATNPITRTQEQRVERRMPSARLLGLSVLVSALVGVIVFAVLHETRLPNSYRVTTGVESEPMQPPLTAEEEAYAATLWPIHSAVKLAAVNMTFAGLAYKLGELDRSGLHSRLEALTARFAEAALQFSQLLPSASLQGLHEEYGEALRLYQVAIMEMARVVDDGRDEHLLVAQEQSERAAGILIKRSDALWPGEYKPN